MLDLNGIGTTKVGYAIHNNMHRQYGSGPVGLKKQTKLQEDHEAVVRRIIDLGGAHLIRDKDPLDLTLPQELVGTNRLRYLSTCLELSEEDPPVSRVQVLRTGTFHHPGYGKFTITDNALATMVKNFRDYRPKPPTEMVVEWEHMGTSSVPVKAPAAGWVQAVEAEPDKLFTIVEWTETAAEEIRRKEYRFISPEFDFNYKDKETGKRIGPTLISVTLTNRPFLEGMEPVILSENLSAMLCTEGIELLTQDPNTDAALEAAVGDGSDDDGIAILREATEKLMEKELRKLLGLDEDADIVEAVKALKELPGTPETDSMRELQGKVTAAEEKTNATTLKLAVMERDKAVDAALTARKITPAMKEWAEATALKDPEGFAKFVETAEVVGPELGENGTEGKGDPKETKVTLTETEKAIGLKMGVSEEDLVKAKEAVLSPPTVVAVA